MLKRMLIAVAALAALILLFMAMSGQFGGTRTGSSTTVLIETSMGNVKVELDPTKAPETVRNFLRYVDEKHFDNTVFHRVISDFMIQGGGYPVGSTEERKTHAPIKNESSKALSNERGTIAMARTGDPHSATAQFFINVENNREKLDSGKTQDGWGYTAFGRVTEGMDVVDKIKEVPTTFGENPREKSKPITDVVIKSIRRVEK